MGGALPTAGWRAMRPLALTADVGAAAAAIRNGAQKRRCNRGTSTPIDEPAMAPAAMSVG